MIKKFMEGFKKFTAMFVLIQMVMVLMPAPVALANSYEVDGKVRICHATGNSGKYESLWVSSEGAYSGHDDDKHQKGNDIIPNVRNWDTEGQAIWNNKCEIPVSTVNTKPIITLLGANPVTIERGANFVDPGAEAYDAEEGDKTSSIVKTGTVNSDVTGVYYLYYNVSDSAGLAADQKTREVNVVDTNAPSVPTGLGFESLDRGTSFACGATTTLQPVIPVWNDNTESDFSHYEYTSFHPNGSIGLDEKILNTSEFVNSWMPPADGAYGFAVRAVDTSGNKSNWALTSKSLGGSCQIIYQTTNGGSDTTPPTTPVITGFENPTLSCGAVTSAGSVTVQWTDSIDDMGVAGYEYEIDYPLLGGGRGLWTTFRTVSEYSGSLNEGTHYIRVRAVDINGLYSGWSNTCSITSDWTAPMIKFEIPTPEDGDTIDRDTFEARVSGDEDIVSCKIWLDGNEFEMGQDGETGEWFKVFADLDDGEYEYLVVCSDEAGNDGTSETRTVTIDTSDDNGNGDDDGNGDGDDEGDGSGGDETGGETTPPVVLTPVTPVIVAVAGDFTEAAEEQDISSETTDDEEGEILGEEDNEENDEERCDWWWILSIILAIVLGGNYLLAKKYHEKENLRKALMVTPVGFGLLTLYAHQVLGEGLKHAPWCYYLWLIVAVLVAAYYLIKNYLGKKETTK